MIIWSYIYQKEKKFPIYYLDRDNKQTRGLNTESTNAGLIDVCNINARRDNLF